MESPFREVEKKEAWLPLGLPEHHKVWRVGLDLRRPNGRLPRGTGTQLIGGSSTQTKKHKVPGTTCSGPALARACLEGPWTRSLDT